MGFSVNPLKLGMFLTNNSSYLSRVSHPLFNENFEINKIIYFNTQQQILLILSDIH